MTTALRIRFLDSSRIPIPRAASELSNSSPMECGPSTCTESAICSVGHLWCPHGGLAPLDFTHPFLLRLTSYVQCRQRRTVSHLCTFVPAVARSVHTHTPHRHTHRELTRCFLLRLTLRRHLLQEAFPVSTRGRGRSGHPLRFRDSLCPFLQSSVVTSLPGTPLLFIVAAVCELVGRPGRAWARQARSSITHFTPSRLLLTSS